MWYIQGAVYYCKIPILLQISEKIAIIGSNPSNQQVVLVMLYTLNMTGTTCYGLYWLWPIIANFSDFYSRIEI